MSAQTDVCVAGDVRRVLVIDDSPLIRRLVELSLRDVEGWRVETAESGASGIELAGRATPDVILLDVEMPGLSGPQTLESLRRSEPTRTVPVVFLTALSGPGDTDQLLAAGAAGVITKPFDPATLALEVAGLLGWRG